MNLHSLLTSLPPELVDNLSTEFNDLHQNFFLGRWSSSQLNGGRFGEAVLRIVEYKDLGTFTPIGNQLPRQTIVNHASNNTGLQRSYRSYIPRLTEAVMDFRNGRNVAHLGEIEVNEMDATFVIQGANWILAEIVRIEGLNNPKDAMVAITKIIERKVPIIEEINGRLKILNPKLSSREQILVICYKLYPQSIQEKDLLSLIGDKNKSRIRKTLQFLDKDSLIDYHESTVLLTRAGLRWVEKNIRFDLEI